MPHVANSAKMASRLTYRSIVDSIAILASIFYILAILLALASLRGDGARAAYFRERLAFRLADAECQKATVIVPVKGFDQGLKENLAALAGQDYPDFELIVVVREAGDIDLANVPDALGRVHRVPQGEAGFHEA